MEVLILIFVSALVALFSSFAKKPALVLSIATGGLLLSLGAYANRIINHKWLVNLDYQGLAFDEGFVFFGAPLIIFALLVIHVGYERFKEDVQHTGEYIALLLFSLTGALIMTAFTDLFMFFLGLEILSIPIYVMAGSRKNDLRSNEASLKYFLTGSFATGLLLFGVAWLYGATQSFSLMGMQKAIMMMEDPMSSPMLLIGLLLVMSSFIFKVGAAPFHFWSPDVYDGSPHAVTAFMASIVKLAAFAAFLKIFSIFNFEALADFWQPALAVLIVLTLFVGNLSALRQVRLKRLLAFSSITHAGYTLLIFLTSPMAGYNLWFYLVAYGFSIIAILTVALLVNDEEDRIDSLRGLAKRNPFLAIVAVVSILSLAGIPPTAGFFGKYMVFTTAWTDWAWLVVIALINSAISIYYYLRLIGAVIDRETETTEPKIKVSLPVTIVLVICMIGMLFLTLVPAVIQWVFAR